jgi:hypothetical protein
MQVEAGTRLLRGPDAAAASGRRIRRGASSLGCRMHGGSVGMFHRYPMEMATQSCIVAWMLS